MNKNYFAKTIVRQSAASYQLQITHAVGKVMAAITNCGFVINSIEVKEMADGTGLYAAFGYGCDAKHNDICFRYIAGGKNGTADSAIKVTW